VRVTFGTTSVDLPIASFLQPSKDGEDILSHLVMQAAQDGKNIVDLFSGCGTFTFNMADANSKAVIQAIDNHHPAIAALRKSAAGKRIAAEIRDLYEQPLTTEELNAYDTVVFDPPRAGAEAQAKEIADCDAQTVIAVSCNPASLARDLRHLEDGGYEIISITPVDQFHWSAHLETVTVLKRAQPF
jgi:23S rRNA (uracil1939-C5)-methyltransferase